MKGKNRCDTGWLSGNGQSGQNQTNLTWEGKLGIMENSKEYVTVSLEMKEQGVL